MIRISLFFPSNNNNNKQVHNRYIVPPDMNRKGGKEQKLELRIFAQETRSGYRQLQMIYHTLTKERSKKKIGKAPTPGIS